MPFVSTFLSHTLLGQAGLLASLTCSSEQTDSCFHLTACVTSLKQSRSLDWKVLWHSSDFQGCSRNFADIRRHLTDSSHSTQHLLLPRPQTPETILLSVLKWHFLSFCSVTNPDSLCNTVYKHYSMPAGLG